MSKNTTLKQGGQYKRKERQMTVLLVRSEHIGGVDKMMRQEEQG